MKKFLLIAMVVLALGLVLSSCMNANVNNKNGVVSIKNAISGGVNTTATVVGVVTSGFGDNVVIEDNSAAINVYIAKSGIGNLYKEGDKLKVVGTIELYKGNYSIDPSSTSDVTKIGTGTVAVISIPTNTALSTSDDWMLVKVTNLPVKKVDQNYKEVTLANGTKDITIYSYDSNVRNWLTSLATGDIVSVQGYVKYRYDKWEIVLRDQNDELSK